MGNEHNGISSGKILRKQIVDIILIIIFSVIVYIFAATHDILERIVDFAAQHEKWEVDEFITVSIFLVFALVVFAFRRWFEVRDVNDKLFQKNKELGKAFSEIKLLKGILPICAGCKKIRDDVGYWHQVEV